MSRFFVFVLFFACNSASSIKVIPNSPPAVHIQSHSSGAVLQESYPISVYAIVSDANHSNAELETAWFLDDELICDWSNPDVNGETRCVIRPTIDSAQISVQVVDPDQGGGRDEIEIIIEATQAPTIELISPMFNVGYYSDLLIPFQARITDLEDDGSSLISYWESSIDGELSLNTNPDSSGKIEDFTYLSAGQHAIKLTVEDTSGKTTTESVLISVGGPNALPSCEILSPLSGSVVVIGEEVIFQATAVDDDIPNSDLSITWHSDKDGDFGSSNPSSSGEILFATDTLSANSHTITMLVEDEVGGVCSDIILLSIGTPPSIQLVSPINGDIYTLQNSILFQANITDEEDIPSSIQLVWTSDVNGELSTQSPDSSGLSQFAYGMLQAGAHFIQVTATDSDGLTATASSSIYVNTPPTVDTIIITPTNPTTSDALSVSIATSDVDAHSVSVSYEWLKNGIITSNTISSVSANDTAKGEIWTVRVTPNDGYSNGNILEASITIENTPPSISSVSISPSSPSAIDTLTCSYSSSDIDQDPLMTEVIWTNTSTSQVLTSGNTIDLSQYTLSTGDEIHCAVTVTDSSGDTTTNSDFVTITNSPPVIGSINITPSSPSFNDTLTCFASVSEPDGDAVSLTYQWRETQNSTVLGTSASLDLTTLSLSNAVTIECTITASDPFGASATATTSVSISNNPPVISTSTIDKSSSYNDALISYVATASDPDGDTFTVTWLWENLSTTQSIGTSSSVQLDPSLAMPGDVIQCTTTLTDVHGASTQDVLSYSIDNRAPNTPTVSILPQSPIEQIDELECIATASDPDGDVVSYLYSWEENGTYFSSTALILATETSAGEAWTCTAEAFDGSLSSSSASDTVTISPEFELHTFTNCGATGRYGPSQSDCDIEYTNSVVDVTVSGGIQFWEVPISGTYQIEAWGAKGGNGGESGGYGARVRGDFVLTAGDVIKILVGQKGTNSGNNDASGNSGGGGGGTFVATETNSPLIVAGGGGGGGVVDTCIGSYSSYAVGVDGATSVDGTYGRNMACANVGTNGYGGNGDKCSNGSTPGAGFYSDSHDYHGSYGLRAYAFVNGGNGATQNFDSQPHGGFGGGGAGCYGGGGGGGYSGGGTGHYNNPCRDSGGGGGGSYNLGSNQDNESGVQTGHGLVTISFLY